MVSDVYIPRPQTKSTLNERRVSQREVVQGLKRNDRENDEMGNSKGVNDCPSARRLSMWKDREKQRSVGCFSWESQLSMRGHKLLC